MKYSSNGERPRQPLKARRKVGLYVAWLIAALMLVGAVAGPPSINFGYSARSYSYAGRVSRSHGYGRSSSNQGRDFYTLLRWVCCAVFAYSAFSTFQMKRAAWTWIFGILAVLFNPVVPVYLQRATWQVVDSAAIGVVVTAGIFFWRSSSKRETN